MVGEVYFAPESRYRETGHTEESTGTGKIRVAIIDDYPIIREGLRKLIAEQSDIEVIAEGESTQEAYDLVGVVNPDILLLDINLPDGNGIELTHRLKIRRKEFSIILLTAYDDYEQALHAIRAGATGYCSKDVSPQSLLEGIRQVARGKYLFRDKIYSQREIETWFEDAALRLHGYDTIDAAEHFVPLSKREMDILAGVVRGRSNKEIARDLNISHQTVKNHMTSIFDKMNVADRTQAAMAAIQRGWIRIATSETHPHKVTITR